MYKPISESKDCLGANEFKVYQRNTFKSTSSSVTFNEYELLDKAGVWTSYEAFFGKESLVEALKAQKKTNELHLWVQTHTPFGPC